MISMTSGPLLQVTNTTKGFLPVLPLSIFTSQTSHTCHNLEGRWELEHTSANLGGVISKVFQRRFGFIVLEEWHTVQILLGTRTGVR